MSRSSAWRFSWTRRLAESDRLGQDAAGLLLDLVRRLVAQPDLGRQPLSEERVLDALLVEHRPHALAHPVVGDHAEREVGRLPQILLRAGRRRSP